MNTTFAPPIRNLDPKWRTWIETNLKADVDPVIMQRSMIAAGWSEADADHALSAVAAEIFPHLFDAPAPLDMPRLPETGTFTCDGRTIHVSLRITSPGIALCHNVFSHDEVAALLSYAATRGLTPSTVVDPDTGAHVPHPERTSNGLMLKQGENALIRTAEQRLAALTSWPTQNSEGLQILRYRHGQEYRAHYDAFSDEKGLERHLATGGQRLATILVYLKSPAKGGATAFPSAGITLCPQPGDAIIFTNVDRTGARAANSLHAGLPVETGEKVVLTCWQRARAFKNT